MDGALIIDKPAGMTSHDVVARVRKTIGERRVGHTGTLDPFATGMLVLLLGRATRLAQFLSSAEKEYQAVIRLGYATDTGDATGTWVSTNATEELSSAAPLSTVRRGGGREASDASQPRPGSHPTREEGQLPSIRQVEASMSSLRGEIEQVPPMYSAKKIGGRKLYELARRGEVVERTPVRVTIHALEFLSHGGELLKQNDDGSADLHVRIVCSAGTYIRTLAEDLGKKLGLGAHLAELRRTRVGQFSIKDALTFDELTTIAESGSLPSKVLSLDVALSHLPELTLAGDEIRCAINGMDLNIDEHGPDWNTGQPVRLRRPSSELVAVGIFDKSRKIIHPKVVISDQ